MSKELIERHEGNIPDNLEDLIQLSGVSTYIAAAVRSFAFGHPEPILDTNTVRIVGRIFGKKINDGSRRSKEFRTLYSSMQDPVRAREFNYGMLDLGALVCKPKVPDCPNCPFEMMCLYGKSAKLTSS